MSLGLGSSAGAASLGAVLISSVPWDAERETEKETDHDILQGHKHARRRHNGHRHRGRGPLQELPGKQVGCLIGVLQARPTHQRAVHEAAMRRWRSVAPGGRTYPELTLIPVLGEGLHGQLHVGAGSGRRHIGSMLLLGQGLELPKVLGAGVALGVERLQGIERGGRERPVWAGEKSQ